MNEIEILRVSILKNGRFRDQRERIHPLPKFRCTDMLIDEKGVHVWQVSLAQDTVREDCFAAILDTDETRRAARFHFPKDRARFVVARASLRLILARYLNKLPSQIRFYYGPKGKPHLERSGLEPRLHFNLSHSHEVGLVAVTYGRQVGVDVEKVTPHSVEHLSIAEQCFTPAEAELIKSASAEMRDDVFFRLWTRKEAFLKGCGDGLSRPLNQFEVSLEKSAIRLMDSSEEEGRNWSVHELQPCPGYIAAVAIRGGHPKIKFLRMERGAVDLSVNSSGIAAIPRVA